MINIWPLYTQKSGQPGCYVAAEPVAGDEFAGMYKTLRRGFRELGQFDDIVRAGWTPWKAKNAMIIAESTDIWTPAGLQVEYNSSQMMGRYGTYGSVRQTLYITLLHTRQPLDLVIESDAVDGHLAQYQVLYCAETHISDAATAGIARWVHAGGTLFASAGCGAFNEYNETNHPFANLVGGHTVEMYAGSRGLNNTLDWVKEQLPWAEQLDAVTLSGASPSIAAQQLGVFGHKAKFQLSTAGVARPTEVLGTFVSDGSVALQRSSVGKGAVVQCSFHPGLAYFSPALPRRPADRGCSEQSYNHMIPTEFAAAARDILLVSAATPGRTARNQQPVITSEPLVDATVILARHAMVGITIVFAHKRPYISRQHAAHANKFGHLHCRRLSC